MFMRYCKLISKSDLTKHTDPHRHISEKNNSPNRVPGCPAEVIPEEGMLVKGDDSSMPLKLF